MNADTKAAAPARTETAGIESNRPQPNAFPARPQARELPQFLRDMISAPPRAGTGVHLWLFKIARHLHHHRAPADIEKLLATAAEGCGRHVSEKEIRDAVENSKAAAWTPNGQPTTSAKPRPKWPARDESRIAEILAEPYTLADLWEASPARLEPGAWTSEMIVEILFPGGTLLCVGKSTSEFLTAPRSSFQNLSDCALIVPSAMSATHGRTQGERKLSMHTLENTGPRQYLVAEFDQGTQDEQSALIHHLAGFAPLVLVLSSGGKSLHAWFSCDGATDDEQRRFFRYGVALGADDATWSPCQFVRLPEGWRADKSARQAVYYFDFQSAKGGARQA